MKYEKSVLSADTLNDQICPSFKLIQQSELQQDFDYFRAQMVAQALFDRKLISLSEFNKLSRINRDTFSPMWAEIMPEIS
jgi:hypothetical protein